MAAIQTSSFFNPFLSSVTVTSITNPLLSLADSLIPLFEKLSLEDEDVIMTEVYPPSVPTLQNVICNVFGGQMPAYPTFVPAILQPNPRVRFSFPGEKNEGPKKGILKKSALRIPGQPRAAKKVVWDRTAYDMMTGDRIPNNIIDRGLAHEWVALNTMGHPDFWQYPNIPEV